MMEAYYSDDHVTLHLGDSLDVLPTLPDASVDAVVCDPPYELGFMGKAWDASGIAYNVDVWRQCWRVLKPGGHLLAFGGTRTYHRMTVAIEDAGFEIRDSLHWIYGSGFPKGQDIARSIDRRRDDREQVLRVTAWLAEAVAAAGWNSRRLNDLFGFDSMAGHWLTQGKAATIPTPDQWQRIREAVGFDDSAILPTVEELHARTGQVGEAWSQREVVGTKNAGLHQGTGDSVMLRGMASPASGRTIAVTAPASEDARKWHGWNTALKPAHEPIVLARKTTGLNSTAANVLEHGTGALNIDGCRTESSGPEVNARRNKGTGLGYAGGAAERGEWDGVQGRWPTNILLGHGPDCVDACRPGCPVPELGEEARFFPAFRYEAKAPASERPRLADGTAHTTVKPLALMRWLVRLVTPPGGTVLDPFAGSGTTLEACRLESFHAIGIEKDPAHAELCQVRLNKPYMTDLFGGAA